MITIIIINNNNNNNNHNNSGNMPGQITTYKGAHASMVAGMVAL